jgi:hypothetical protein
MIFIQLVVYVPEQRLGDRKRTTRWIKIILHHNHGRSYICEKKLLSADSKRPPSDMSVCDTKHQL